MKPCESRKHISTTWVTSCLSAIWDNTNTKNKLVEYTNYMQQCQLQFSCTRLWLTMCPYCSSMFTRFHCMDFRYSIAKGIKSLILLYGFKPQLLINAYARSDSVRLNGLLFDQDLSWEDVAIVRWIEIHDWQQTYFRHRRVISYQYKCAARIQMSLDDFDKESVHLAVGRSCWRFLRAVREVRHLTPLTCHYGTIVSIYSHLIIKIHLPHRNRTNT